MAKIKFLVFTWFDIYHSIAPESVKQGMFLKNIILYFSCSKQTTRILNCVFSYV